MTYETLAQQNVSEGFHVFFVYLNDVTGGVFTGMILFALFIIVLLSSYFSQSRLFNSGDLSVSYAVAGYFTASVAIILSLIPGLINLIAVVICVVNAIIGTLWLYMNKSSD